MKLIQEELIKYYKRKIAYTISIVIIIISSDLYAASCEDLHKLTVLDIMNGTTSCNIHYNEENLRERVVFDLKKNRCLDDKDEKYFEKIRTEFIRKITKDEKSMTEIRKKVCPYISSQISAYMRCDNCNFVLADNLNVSNDVLKESNDTKMVRENKSSQMTCSGLVTKQVNGHLISKEEEACDIFIEEVGESVSLGFKTNAFPKIPSACIIDKISGNDPNNKNNSRQADWKVTKFFMEGEKHSYAFGNAVDSSKIFKRGNTYEFYRDVKQVNGLVWNSELQISQITKKLKYFHAYNDGKMNFETVFDANCK